YCPTAHPPNLTKRRWSIGVDGRWFFLVFRFRGPFLLFVFRGYFLLLPQNARIDHGIRPRPLKPPNIIKTIDNSNMSKCYDRVGGSAKDPRRIFEKIISRLIK